MIIGAQGYTIRNFVRNEEEIKNSLKKLKEIGYNCLQVSSFGPVAPHILKEICGQNGLEIIVTHVNPDRILKDTDKVIEEHKILGCKHIGISCMPERYIGSLSGLRQFIKDYNPVAVKLNDHGLKLQYHNHFFEYMRQDGKAFMDILAEETSPELWGFILDVFWTQFSGRCPAQQIRMLKGRIDVCHLKDISLNGREQRTAAVMEGNLCWDEIFAACWETGVKYAMVEQDDTYGKDPFDELALSLNNLKNAGFIQ